MLVVEFIKFRSTRTLRNRFIFNVARRKLVFILREMNQSNLQRQNSTLYVYFIYRCDNRIEFSRSFKVYQFSSNLQRSMTNLYCRLQHDVRVRRRQETEFIIALSMNSIIPSICTCSSKYHRESVNSALVVLHNTAHSSGRVDRGTQPTMANYML